MDGALNPRTLSPSPGSEMMRLPLLNGAGLASRPAGRGPAYRRDRWSCRNCHTCAGLDGRPFSCCRPPSMESAPYRPPVLTRAPPAHVDGTIGATPSGAITVTLLGTGSPTVDPNRFGRNHPVPGLAIPIRPMNGPATSRLPPSIFNGSAGRARGAGPNTTRAPCFGS